MASSIRDRLIALAARRHTTIRIEGEEFTLAEVGADAFGLYGLTMKTDRTRAIAILLSACIVDPDTLEPVLSLEDAIEIAASSGRVTVPLVSEILQLSGYGEDQVLEGVEKKA